MYQLQVSLFRKFIPKAFVFLLLLFFSLTGSSQPNIARVEYYIDLDPGYALATPLTISPATSLSNLSININPATLSSGVHQLGVRAKDENGSWSLDNRWLFFKPFSSSTSLSAPSNLSYIEYYIDVDPGFGNAISIPVSATTNASNLLININPSTLSSGVHLLGARARDANGNWSLDNRWLFYKPFTSTSGTPSLPAINYAEWYVDTDPGYGNGTSVAVNGTDAGSLLINIDPNILASGVHQFAFRAKDANGSWSLDNRWLFFKPYSNTTSLPSRPNITYAEWFVDTDPGYGNGTAVATTQAADLTNVLINVDPATLGSGVHQFVFRAKDANGSWSLANRWLFFKPYTSSTQVVAAPNLLSLEYYIDNDPGIGKGTSVSIPLQKDISNLSIPVDIRNLAAGGHTIFLRAKDINGSWSLVNKWGFTLDALLLQDTCSKSTLAFDGVDDIVKATNVPTTSNYTIEAWVKVSDTRNSNIIVATNNSGPLAAWSHQLRIKNGKFEHYTFDGAQHSLTGTTVITPDQWYHVAITASQNGTMKLYVNGAQEGPAVAVTTPWTLGSQYWFGSNSADAAGPTLNFFKGEIEEVRIWDKELTGTEIADWKNKVVTTSHPEYSSLKHYWRMEEGSGSASTDLMNGQQATLNNFDLSNCWTTSTSPIACRPAVKQSQDIVFDSIPTKTFGDAPFTLRAVASSGLPVTYSLSSGPALLDSNKVTITGAGIITVRALQAGNDTYATVEKEYSIIVQKANASITLSNLAKVYNGSAQVPSVTTSPTGLSYQLTFNGTTTSPVNVGKYEVIALINNPNYSGEKKDSFEITKASQTITLNPVSDKQYGNAPFKISGLASSGLPLSFSIVSLPSGIASVSNDTLILYGTGTVILKATQEGNSSYYPATSVSDTFEVTRGNQNITFQVIPDKIVTDSPFGIQVSVNTGLPLSYELTTIPATGVASLTDTIVTLLGDTGTVSIRVLQAGNDLYNLAQTSRSFMVKAPSGHPDLTVQNVTSSLSELGPQDTVAVSWRIANIGTQAAALDWTERIYMQTPDGRNRSLIKQVTFKRDSLLAASTFITQSEILVMPVPLNIGDQAVFVVEVTPSPAVNELPEDIANNTGIQSTPWAIRKSLTISLTESTLQEGGSGTKVAVKRTGSLLEPLNILVSFMHAQRFSSPFTVSIPSGESGTSFNFYVVDNNLVEGTLKDKIQVSATGFISADADLTLLDDEKPSLSISLLPKEVTESSSTSMRISTDLAPAQDLKIYLSSSQKTRFPLPASVVLPKGSLYLDLPLNVPDNSIPEIDVAVTLQATATDYQGAFASILLKDNDLPGLELVLQTHLVSEGAGAYATKATLRRLSGTSSIAFTANLSTSQPNTLILPTNISLGVGELEKTFGVGTIDNSLVDGTRSVAITAALYVTSCGCSAPPATSGFVSDTLTVTDNDGPALLLTTTELTLPEGPANTTKLRVSRNTNGGPELSVALVSSNTDEATLPAFATIPTGETFVEVPITTINDGKSDGSKQVYFTATAASYAPGTMWVIVSDQNKPDFQIQSALISKDTVQASSLLSYQLTIKNTGFAIAPSGVRVRAYLSKDTLVDPQDSLLSEDIIPVTIPIDGTASVVNAAQVPNLPGNFNVVFWVNPTSSLTELLLTNNLSTPQSLTILPDYTATATLSETEFFQGATIPVFGTAQRESQPAANVPVEVYIITNGLRRTLTAQTDPYGAYTTEFIPMSAEAGHYSVGASYPGLESTTEQASFDILGVKVNDGKQPRFIVLIQDTLKGSISVQNLSSRTLNQFTLSALNVPSGAHFRFDTMNVGPKATVLLKYAITGSNLSPGALFETAQLKAVSNEGIIQKISAYYYCQAPGGFIEADVARLNVKTSVNTAEKVVEFRIINKGKGQTGTINLLLPKVDWIGSITPLNLPSLNSGDTAVVSLRFRTLDEVPFDYPISGNIGLVATSGNMLSLPFTFEKVAESKGSVKVAVTDMFTYYAADAPKVAGARVEIRNYFTGEIYASGVTGTDGLFTASEIPEGKHRIIVEKDKYLPYNNVLTINPGDTTSTSIFLNYQAITFSWGVEPTPIEDEYDITLITKFETHIPMPVVTIDMPKRMPHLSGNETYAFKVTLTNQGLIKADSVVLNLPTNDPEYEFVTNYQPADLLAQQSIQVPVLMRRRTTIGYTTIPSSTISIAALSQILGMQEKDYKYFAGSAPCNNVTTIVYGFKCDLASGKWMQTNAVWMTFTDRICSSGGGGGNEYIVPPPSGGGGNGDIACAICPDPKIFAGDPNWKNPFVYGTKSCQQCINDLAQALLGCTPFDNPYLIGPKCFVSTALDKGKPKDMAQCELEGVVEEIASHLPYIKEVLCLKGLIQAMATCAASFGSPGPIGTSFRKGGSESSFSTQLSTSSGPSDVSTRIQLNEETDSTSSSASRQFSTSSGPSGVFSEIQSKLELVSSAYSLRAKWITEYFGKLPEYDSWPRFSRLFRPYFDSLVVVSDSAQQRIESEMSGFDMPISEIQQFFVRWNPSIIARNSDILAPNSQYPNIINWISAKSWSDSLVDIHNYAVASGFGNVEDMHVQSYTSLDTIINGQKNAVCASVTVQISQKLTMTREAFTGTLDIFNGHPSDAMDSLSVNIEIKDANGVLSNSLFEIQTKSLMNLSDVTGTGAIASQQTGTAKFLFIPTINAAPTAPKDYFFGGTIRYWDPYVKSIVSLPLAPEQLTVNPSPNLMLHYFMERNILGDDPLTSPDIEPTIPAELAVLVENQGYGPAVNMIISSAQPKIVDNEKGLAVNFSLIGSNFQGQPKKMGVTDINFGTVPPQESRIGEWYFTSSLLGKFVSYETNVVHNNSFGNPELSLVKGVQLHELTHSIEVYGTDDDGINDFLVNDIFDVKDVPDVIYYSQGRRTESVVPAASGSFSSPVQGPTFTNVLTVTPSTVGWNYLKLPDPGNRRYELVSVIRSDGQVIPLDNVWLTFVTLPISQPPVYENKFHFVDKFPSVEPTTYTLVWKPVNLNVPHIVRIEGAPTEVTGLQVKKLTVVFDKAIDSSTFNYEDITLTFQGGPNLSDNRIKITQLDSIRFEVDLSALTLGNGFFMFTAQAAGVKDIYGISGTVGKQVGWSQFLDRPVVQAFLQIPEAKIAANYDTVAVEFNLPVDVETMTSDRFRVRKDGTILPGMLNIDSIRGDRQVVYLSGLNSLITSDGPYQFVVDVAGIKSADGVAGVDSQYVELRLDKTGPQLLHLEKSGEGGLDSLHYPFVHLQFDEDVKGFTTGALQLKRNGIPLALNLNQLSNTDLKNWLAGNFGLLTYPDGAYQFIIDLSQVKDALGNFGSGIRTLEWTVSRSATIIVSNLGISPDKGYLNTDAVTAGQNLTVSFQLNEAVQSVRVYQTDFSNQMLLTTENELTAGVHSLPIQLSNSGNLGIKVVAMGINGAEVSKTLDLFVDPVPLTASWVQGVKETLNRQPDSIALEFSSRLLNSVAEVKAALQLRKNGFILPQATISLTQLTDSSYLVAGLRSIDTTQGQYQLSANLRGLNKYTTGREGESTAAVLWSVVPPNRRPIANAGTTQIITTPGLVQLDGSASIDPDGDMLTYEWTAPSGIILANDKSVRPSFSLSGAQAGQTLRFLLSVSDGKLFATATVDVIANFTSELQVFYKDEDGDGYGNGALTIMAVSAPSGYVTNNTDCNDYDSTVYPGAPELCDGKDNNCNGQVDEGIVLTSYYKDKDGDGYGDIGVSLRACTQPLGYVTDSTDCNDNDAAVHTLITYYRDADGDGYGDSNTSQAVCSSTPPTGYVRNNTDCNDNDNTVYLGASELCDGKDNNCDGQVDEGIVLTSYYKDKDGDGYGDPLNSIQSCSQPIGYVSNNTDCNDSDGSIHSLVIYYRDQDGDGFGAAGQSITVCSLTAPVGYVSKSGDCNDADATVYPGALEVCDGKDNNCDGQIDEGLQAKTWYRDRDGDGYGNPANSVQACSQPTGYVSNNKDCDDSNPAVHPAAVEICDGLDNDCNGKVDDKCVSNTLPQITISDAMVYENAGVAAVTVTVSKPSSQVVTVKYNTANGSAMHPKDYERVNGLLTFPAGATNATISVIIKADNFTEGAETFTINLSNATNAVIADDLGLVTILDPPTMTITNKQRETGPQTLSGVLDAVIKPNPSNTYFNVIISGSNEVKAGIRVFDALGRVVEARSGIFVNTGIRIGDKYGVGLYFVEVTQGNNTKLIKIIKE